MLQVKDPQEVFDENIKPLLEEGAIAQDIELTDEILNTPYSIFVLGEMYGSISTCLAQNIPIPKEMWDMPVVQSFVRGDVDDVVVVDGVEALTNDDVIAKSNPLNNLSSSFNYCPRNIAPAVFHTKVNVAGLGLGDVGGV